MKRIILTIILNIIIITLAVPQLKPYFPEDITQRINQGDIDTNLIFDIKKSLNNIYTNNTISFDTKINIIDSAINLSNSINYNEGSARLYNLKGIVAYYSRKNEMANKNYKKAMEIIKVNGLNNTYFDFYINLCNSMLETDDDSAYFYINNLLKDAKIYNDSIIIGRSLSTLARYYYLKEDVAKYITLLKEASNYFNKNDYNSRAPLYINLGIANFEIENYKKSNEYYQKALKANKKVGNANFTSTTYNNLGRLYHVGFMKYDSAVYYFNKSLNLKDSLNDKYGKLSILINLGNVYYDKNDLDKALSYFKMVENNKLIEKLPQELTANTINTGIIYTEKKEYKLAKQYLNKGLQLANKNMNQYRKNAYLYLSEIALSENNAALLNTYKDSIISIKSRIWDEELKQTIASIKVENNLKKLENDKKLLENKNQLNQKKLQIKNIVLIATISLISILLFLIYTILKGRKKINIINNKLQLNNQKLEKTNNELNKLNQRKDKFFSIIAHDLKGPIGATSSLISQLQSRFDYFDQDAKQEILESLKRTGVATFELLENLLDWARTQKNEFEYNEEVFSLEEVVVKVFSLLDAKAKSKNQKLLFNSTINDLKIRTDKKMLNTILVNLINNSIKFSKENTEIKLTAEVKEDKLQLRVVDQGVGIEKEKQKTLFDIGSKITTYGTNNEKGTGLGLIISKEFSKLMNAKLLLEKSSSNGSTFLLEIKL